jgi:hypothetical protein
MSTAFYPQGMKTYNNHLPQGGYKSWKDRFPVGITPTHIRPLTNKDSSNWYPAPFGRPRPLKQYRKGVGNSVGDSRVVKSSLSQSINGGLGLLGQMQGVPGNYQVKETRVGITEICENCKGLKIIDNYKPQPTYLTDNPEPLITETKALCCNPEKNALKGVIYASQNCQDANYYPNSIQRLQNKCMTYDQKVFGFVRKVSPTEYLTNCQPYGGTDCSSTVVPDFSTNTYVISNPTAADLVSCTTCKVAVYKPSNKPFAVQSSVRSSTRTAKLTADTLENGYSMIYNDKLKVETQQLCYIQRGNSCPSYTNQGGES